MTSAGDVFIVSAARTPIGNFQGTLSTLSAAELGAVAIKEVLERAKVAPPDVDEVILGQALTAGQGQNPARQAAIKAGLPKEVPAYLINMLCGSGLKTVALGYQAIRAGDASVIVAGGQECMSKAPHVLHLRNGTKMGEAKMVDSMLSDGLTDAFYDLHMGVTAENLAKEFDIDRVQQDAFAARSQQLAEESQKNNFFKEEIVAVPVPGRKETIIFDKDEYPKHGTTVEGLAKLRPCFIKDGTVTPGNASGINDSAAAVLLMSAEEVQKRDVKPLAKIVAFAQTGICPKTMGAGPITAVQKVLLKAGWKLEDIDLFELNEAFAAQALAVNKGLDVDPAKVNIGGGAIALGHPIGASGCRVLVTLLYALKRTGGKKGIASLCVGGGMGVAMAVELL
ncbi:acetyl-CoA acetyltransferase [Toxorhynchites rutilus septentrionalis]|uniref:acetyl-CoA acetyltransferase n=1 Tax=Toxorhynchites rutilus septentrionalis TaxID=329112 RepID=UPI0024794C65|nr:acetyl-CoA acetyltransferase [Toxorhynchites rutilus septentrionalis]XP_055642951.1 acetyl-CoA acetyltransferase [Toxorhynchites rutilus septentrionalis]